jgi:hypothetical protein
MEGLSRRMVESGQTKLQHSVLVNVIVKAPDKGAAEEYVKERMNDWFSESLTIEGNHNKWPNGTLLLWNFYEPKVINGR